VTDAGPGAAGIHVGPGERVTAVVLMPQDVRRFVTVDREYLATNALDVIDFKLPSLP
jgi:hypothetical protein